MEERVGISKATNSWICFSGDISYMSLHGAVGFRETQGFEGEEQYVRACYQQYQTQINELDCKR